MFTFVSGFIGLRRSRTLRSLIILSSDNWGSSSAHFDIISLSTFSRCPSPPTADLGSSVTWNHSTVDSWLEWCSKTLNYSFTKIIILVRKEVSTLWWAVSRVQAAVVSVYLAFVYFHTLAGAAENMTPFIICRIYIKASSSVIRHFYYLFRSLNFHFFRLFLVLLRGKKNVFVALWMIQSICGLHAGEKYFI